MLWLIFIGGIGVGVAYGVIQLVGAAADVVAAGIGAAAMLAVPILRYALALSEKQETELQKQKQANYENLLNKLANFIRTHKKDNDRFASAHVYSWVVGSRSVVTTTQSFIETPSDVNLKALLLEMRKDLGMFEKEDEELKLTDLFSEDPVETPGKLIKDKEPEKS